MFGLAEKSLLDQLPGLLRAMGVKLELEDVTDVKAEILTLIPAATAAGVKVVHAEGHMRGGGKLRALLIVSE